MFLSATRQCGIGSPSASAVCPRYSLHHVLGDGAAGNIQTNTHDPTRHRRQDRPDDRTRHDGQLGRDLRVDRVPPGSPGPGQALLRVTAVGICGSDLHSYQDARIGDTMLNAPLTLGHEFAGVVEEIGPGEALDGEFQPLQAGARVAVDPAQPCGRCEMCEQGHPNLCRRLHFCGLYPDEGSLSHWILVPAHTCFPRRTPSTTPAARRLAAGRRHSRRRSGQDRVADSVAILGAGAIGLLILQPHFRRQPDLCGRSVSVAFGRSRGTRRHPHQFREQNAAAAVRQPPAGAAWT